MDPAAALLFSFALFPGPKPASFPYYRDSTVRFVAEMKRRFPKARFVAHVSDTIEASDLAAICAAAGACVRPYGALVCL
jgi:hypothetical protein